MSKHILALAVTLVLATLVATTDGVAIGLASDDTNATVLGLAPRNMNLDNTGARKRGWLASVCYYGTCEPRLFSSGGHGALGMCAGAERLGEHHPPRQLPIAKKVGAAGAGLSRNPQSIQRDPDEIRHDYRPIEPSETALASFHIACLLD